MPKDLLLHRKCPKCQSNENVIRSGKYGRRLRYYCKACNKYFIVRRPTNTQKDKILFDYVWRGVGANYLARLNKMHVQTVQKIIRDFKVDMSLDYTYCPIYIKNSIQCIMIDTLYLGEGIAIIVIIDANTKRLLYFKQTRGAAPTKVEFEHALLHLASFNISPKICAYNGQPIIKSCILKRGITPQYCLYHASLKVKNIMKTAPKTPWNKGLIQLMYDILNAGNDFTINMFCTATVMWREKYDGYLQARHLNEKGERVLSFPETGSVFRFLNSNYREFFAYQAFPDLNSPRTLSILQGKFSVIKDKLRLHKGCNPETKIKIAFLLLRGPKEEKFDPLEAMRTVDPSTIQPSTSFKPKPMREEDKDNPLFYF